MTTPPATPRVCRGRLRFPQLMTPCVIVPPPAIGAQPGSDVLVVSGQANPVSRNLDATPSGGEPGQAQQLGWLAGKAICGVRGSAGVPPDDSLAPWIRDGVV